ncbi:MAG: nucleotidyltransferase domain-containing protein [Gammaproteobacteria bacterium]
MTYPEITAPILAAHPTTQAIYLYGSWGTGHQHPGSEINLAVLLPHADAKTDNRLEWERLATSIARIAHVDYANLVNLWLTNLDPRIEVLRADRVIHCTDEGARISFEALTLTMWQDWNFQRARYRKEMLEHEKHHQCNQP